MNNVYLVTIRNPSSNPASLEERYIYADSRKDAELQAIEIVANHPFDDVELVSVELLEPGNLYHEH